MGIELFGWYIGRKPMPMVYEVEKVIGNATVVQLVVCHPAESRQWLFYQDCKQALTEHPTGTVSILPVVLADGKFYSAKYGLDEVQVQPGATK